MFENFYDRLGKYLHADNPWGVNKGLENLAKEIPGIVASARALLWWHLTTIRTPLFSGVWVVEAPANGYAPRIIVAKAEGEFIVT